MFSFGCVQFLHASMWNFSGIGEVKDVGYAKKLLMILLKVIICS